MEETKACLFSYTLDGNGGGHVVDLSLVTSEDPRLVWIHLNGRHPDAKKFLKEQLHLDPLIIKSLLAEETRPRLEEVGDNALIILRGIHYNPGPAPEDLVSVRLFVSKQRIVSVGRRKSKSIADIDQRLADRRGPKTAGEFVAMLCNSLHDSIEPVIQNLYDTTDSIEDKSLENPDAAMRGDIALIRKQSILFRRHMAPQKDVISRLRNAEMEWLSVSDKWYLQDNHDRITRFIEDLDAIRDRSQILQDELSSALSSRLNKNIYVLSVITAIFMPLSFLSGLLGMNVAGIPHADHPMAFLTVCALAALVVLTEITLFRRLKWI